MQKDGQYLLNLLPGMIIGFFTIGDEYPGIIAKDGQGWIFERDVINPRPITQSEVVERGATDETADAAAELLTPDEWTWLEGIAAERDSKKKQEFDSESGKTQARDKDGKFEDEGKSDSVAKGTSNAKGDTSGKSEYPGDIGKNFSLVDGRYQWTGPVKPENVEVKFRRRNTKLSPVVESAIKFAGARLFADRPVHIEVVFDNAIGGNQGALGASSTSEDGSRAQVYLHTKDGGEAINPQTVARFAIHELVHTWQQRQGDWPEPDVSKDWHERLEEQHAIKVEQLLGNEFVIKHGKDYGWEAEHFLNHPKYFDSTVRKLGGKTE